MSDEEPPTIDATSPVRPYVITGGRTRSVNADLAVETVVETKTTTMVEHLDFERRAIAEQCRQPLSIAELASHLELPLGVARVLVSDMADEGLLHAHDIADLSDHAFIKRLQEGIRSL